jgi:RHS repeat-associated protein
MATRRRNCGVSGGSAFPRVLPRRLTDRLGGSPRVTSYGYDAVGRATTVSRPNGVVTTSGFHPETGRLNAITHARSGATVVAWSASHRLGGDLSSETTAGRVRSYEYDGAGRLTLVNDAGAVRRYAYDANANRCGLAAACQAGWSYDNADRILVAPGSTYAYDVRGNVTRISPSAGAATSFAFDGNNHATVIDDPVNRTEETLAPDGRVLVRKVTSKATGQVTQHVELGYDDKSDSPAYERPVGNPLGVTSYLDGPGGVLAIQSPLGVRWPLANGRGDIVGTTDAAGVYTAKPVADEFGVAQVTGDRLGWLGMHQRYTAATESGIIRMGHRLYDPRIGRFLQVDPIAGGSCNDYDYVCADPINSTDLDGQAKCKGWWGCARSFVWKHKVDIALTALSFTGVGSVVWAYRAYRLVRLARAGAQSARATRATGWLAGRMWVGRGGARGVARNGARMFSRGSGAGQRAWRGPARKHGFGWSSNLTSSVRGRHDYRNFHINHRGR